MAKRIGLIGLRHMGNEHYLNLLELARQGRLELVALCDNEPSTLELPPVRHSLETIRLLLAATPTDKNERLRLRHEIMQQVCAPQPAMFTDYRQMLERVAMDGLIVCTPNFHHREMVSAALARDINVLCEKPLAPNVEDCQAILDAEAQSAAFVQVGLHMRYRVLNHHIKQLLDDGRLGDLKMAWCQEFRGDWNPDASRTEDVNGQPTNWRYLQAASGGSLVEKLCHDFDLFAWWIGAPAVSVSAMGGRGMFTDRETIDHANILVQYANDVQLNVSLCMFSNNHRFKGRYMGLIGELATLDLDNALTGCVLYRHDGTTERFDNVEPITPPGYHAGKASLRQLDSFIDCLESRTAPLADAKIGRDSVAVAQAAEQAIREQRVVEVPAVGVVGAGA